MSGTRSDGASGAGEIASLRSIAFSTFVPGGLFEVGNGAITPVIALTALDLGASPAQAGFVLSLLGIGQVVGDIPASSLADRLGERRAMVVAATLAVVALAACLLVRSLVIFGAALIVLGMANATFYLARHAYLTEALPARLRGRAMSTLGGSLRVGLFIGPFLGAGVISISGMRGAYVVAMVCAASVALMLLVIQDPEPAQPALTSRPDEGGSQPAGGRNGGGTWQVLLAHRRLFATFGLAVIAVGAIRAARQTALPLWSEHLGVNAVTTSVIFGIAGAAEVALFYPSGKLMDQYGRLAIALPSMIILAFALMILPLSQGPVSLTLIAILIGVGNGMGSGIMMTLGSDASPAIGRIRFLGIWRVLGDTGSAAGPLIVSIGATLATLAAGIVAVGSVGLLAAAGLTRWVPKYTPYAFPGSAPANRRHAPPAGSDGDRAS